MMKDPFSELLHARTDIEGAHPAVSPLFQNSSFLQESPHFYLRKQHPNVMELETALSAIEGGAFVTAVASGMAAISQVLHLLKPGDALVVDKLMYGCSLKLCKLFCAQFGIQIIETDLGNDTFRPGQLPKNTKLVFFETPTNPFLRSRDIKRVSEGVKSIAPNALIAVDNTWATPLFQRPLDFGADISLVSATKYYSGHSDCMGGLLSTYNQALDEKFKQFRFYHGSVLEPYSAWLLRRSLQTLKLRMNAHREITQKMVGYLAKCTKIERVYVPELDRQLTDYGGIVFCQLRECRVEEVKKFVKAFKVFQWGTSMATVVSAVAIPYSGSHASLDEIEKKKMGLNPGLVRFSFGMEAPEVLIEDLENAFKVI